MDNKTQTVDTYNNSAQSLAKKFDSLGARTSDIKETLELVKIVNPRVLEIGCGNGRDAEDIVKFTDNYIGIDISEKLVELARQKVPKGNFEVADIENYKFGEGLDVIFAFASLIHVPIESLQKILADAYIALNNNGVMRLSMKYSDSYIETTKEDEFGIRTYYLYSKNNIEKLATGFVVLKNELNDLRGQKWLEIILQKKSSM
ncbi:MAG: class I SAM-dependent methyltransferase [Patescibacteria group bacterium]|jgi:SAM-dependent methyltransferase